MHFSSFHEAEKKIFSNQEKMFHFFLRDKNEMKLIENNHQRQRQQQQNQKKKLDID